MGGAEIVGVIIAALIVLWLVVTVARSALTAVAIPFRSWSRSGRRPTKAER